MKRIIITGGHHNSALPVIEELKKTFPSLEIHWIGHRRSMKGDKSETLEYREIIGLKIPFYTLHAGKVYKTYNPFRLLKVPVGFIQSLYLLLKIKPDLILSFGGYLAVPVVIIGKLLKIPSLTHEQTVVAGHANRVISKFADRVLVSWQESKKFFPKHKVVHVGLPLRNEIFSSESTSFSVNESMPTVYITAGKTGSHKINLAVNDSLGKLLSICNVIHQCGDHSKYKDFDALTNTYNLFSQKPPGKYFLRKFVFSDEIGETFSKADLVVSRSGAHITYELIALNKPVILIPIPWVSHNEQYENARVLEKLGLGRILEEVDLSGDSLLNLVRDMIRKLQEARPDVPRQEKHIIKDSAKRVVKEIVAVYAKSR
jgi:UDP-N-acetylglucosamine--N-acetylmuramyl-(pentapeptide) pyrophosphoryl-undecaprenol N-acetylglucosamine transferase